MHGEFERPSTDQHLKVILQISVATLIRLLFNTARRFVYPFAPVLSRGLGVSLTATTSLIAATQFSGIFSLLFGPLGDKWGYRRMLWAGSAILVVGMFAAGLFPFYGVVLLGLLLAGLGKSVFDPSAQAFIGRQVPYRRRGLAVGIAEMNWAGSSLIGIPLVGLLIGVWGWRAPFFAIGAMGLMGWVLLVVLFSEKRNHQVVQNHAGIIEIWRRVGREPAAMGAVGYTFFISFANDNLFVVYGIWLESYFGLSVVAVGSATVVIGIAELLGEGLTATISDRLGLIRAIVIGCAITIFCYLLLPFFGKTVGLALAALFLVFLTFEFTIVTSMSLFTEILPGTRATMMSGYLAASCAGRMLGAFSGGMIWHAGGIFAVSVTSALVSGVALLCLVWGLRSWRPDS